MNDMERQIGRAGRDEKSDLVVEIELKKQGGLEIVINSSVKALYGRAIATTAEEVMRQLGVQHARVVLNDKGALDWVIRARIEAAARQAGPVSASIPKARNAAASDKNRLRRTRLYLPGSNPDLQLNASLFGADCLILDLEDSVAPPEKYATRILVKHALQILDFGESECIVRINPLSTPYGAEDLAEIVAAAPDTLLIPKCETAADITGSGRARGGAGKKGGACPADLFHAPDRNRQRRASCL